MKTRFLTTFLLIFLFHAFSASDALAQAQADAGPDQTINEGDRVTLDGSNSSPRNFIINYSWQQTSGSPNVTLKNANKAKASFTAPKVNPGGTSLIFQLTVTYYYYSFVFSLTDTARVNVLFVNNPPVAEAGPNQTVDEGSAVTLNGSNSFDPDFGDSITYQWIQTGGNPTVTLNGANTATPSFTAPNVGPNGTSLTFELTVTDLDGLEDSDTTVVNVSFVNQPPRADAGPNQTKEEETKVTLNGSNSSDPDNGIKSYRWRQTAGPLVRLFNDEAVKPTFTAPNVAGSKSLKFELAVTDFGGLKDTDTTIVNVTGDNDPPTADAGPDQAKEEETKVTLNGSNSSDPDDGIKSYRWRQTAGPPVTLSNPLDVQPTFTPPNVLESGASLTFELIVTDVGSLESVEATIVNVTGDNDPPTANAGVDQTVLEKSTVTLDGSNSFDSDDGIKSYRWKQVAGPSVTFSDPTSDQPTFEAPGFDDSGDQPLILELIVTDNGGLQSSDSTNVSVSNYEKDNPGASGGGCFIDTVAYGFRWAK